jgi:uncharacterized OsmC-like protein
LERTRNNPVELDFSADILWDGENGGQIALRDLAPLKIDALPEFGGKGEQPCPDELFFASIGGCLLTTFLYVRRKLKLPLVHLKVAVNGKIRLQGPQGYRLTSVEATIHMETLRGHKNKAEECVRLTRNFCHLTRLLEMVVPLRLSSKIDCVEDQQGIGNGSHSPSL